METGFELLEERIKKTAELVRRLRKQNAELSDGLKKAKSEKAEAEKRAEAAAAQRRFDDDRKAEVEALERDLAALKAERTEVRNRIAKLVEVLEALDEA